MVQRAGTPALLLVALLLPLLLAGCHDLTGDDSLAPAPPAAAPDTPTPAGPPGANPLPALRLATEPTGPVVAVHITIEGDPSAITHHDVDWGDGTTLPPRPGVPAARYTHEYLPPAHWRDDPRPYTLTVRIHSELGHTRAASSTVEVPPPPNRPPAGRIIPDEASAAVPARTTLRVESEDTDGTITRWTLDPGDGSPLIQDHQAPPGSILHVYRHIGLHTATLTLTDDAGATARMQTEIEVLPPQDHDIWTIAPDNATVYRHDPSGDLLASHTPFGTCLDPPCTRILDATSDRETLALLIEDDEGHAAAILDGQTGHAHTIRLPGQALGIHTGPDGRYWTTHRDGTITWFGRSDTAPRGNVTLPALDATVTITFAPDGTAWVLVSDTTARLHRIDPVARRADPLHLPIPAPAQHLAYNEKHATALVVDDADRAWVATATIWGPVTSRLTTLDGTTPVGVTCPTGHDHCWAVLEEPTARLVPIDMRPQATAVAGMPSVALADDTVPLSLHSATGRLLVATGGAEPRIHIHDAEDGRLLGQTDGLLAGRPQTHPRHPDLIYHLAADGRPTILDMAAPELVHQAPASGGTMGPYLLAHPWEPGR